MRNIKFTLIGLLLACTACNLESDDAQVFTFDDFQNFFNLAYNNTRTYLNGYYNASEVSSDEMIPLSAGPAISEWERLYQHTWTPSDPTMLSIWDEAYEGISLCILALNIGDDSETSISNDFIAELRALRAFYYYLLMDSFGGVPILDSDFAGKAYPPRSSRQEVFDYIEKELTEALPNLSDSPVYGRINRDVANAILAKLYLNAEVYTGTPQWEKCLATCREISVGGRFNLLPDYFENFDPNNHIAATEEIIFYNIFNVSAVPTGIQMNLQSRSLHLAHFGIVDRVQSPFLAVPPDFYNSFQHGEDKRANAFIIGPQFSDFDTTDGTPLEDTQGEQINYTLDIPGFPIAEESSGVRVLKYQLDPSSNGLDANNDFAIFRLSDIILMEAEALNELGDGPGAIELINRVRNRGFASSGADIEDTGFNQTSLRDQILLERGHELFWEGFRRQDLIRHGKFCEERLYKPVDDDCEKRKLFPIPQAVIDVNDAIVQNPGY